MPPDFTDFKNLSVLHLVLLDFYSTFLVFGDNFPDLLGSDASVDFLTDHHDWGKTAGAYTTQAVQGKFPVGRGLAHFDIQLSFYFMQNLLCTPNVASSSHAY